MSTTGTTKGTQEYRSIPIAQLKESSTNPRKTFDDARLAELAESIRSKGVLSPLLVRHVNGYYEIVAGAQRFRAAQRAGLREVPVRVSTFTDAESQEAQLIENLLRADLHPFEEAQGFRALLDQEAAKYTVERIATKTGKPASFIAKRLKLLDLIKGAADAFLAGQIGVEHAQLIAKLAPEIQEEALRRCFDGYYGADDKERSLVPVSRLQAWIEHNVYLSLKSVPFSKDDETLVPEAGSCAKCPKRTGFNTLLFSEVREDSCADAACFNRKLDAHIAQRVTKMPKLVQISQEYQRAEKSPVLPRREYVGVVARKNPKTKNALPENKLCDHLTAAIHTDGVDKGRLVKVCANPECRIHFGNRQREEEQRLAWKAQRTAENRKAKQTASFRHLLLSETLKRVKPQFSNDQMRLVARFVLTTLPHEQVARLAKRRRLQSQKDQHDWQAVEKARGLYKVTATAELARLILEAILIGSVANIRADKEDDLLIDAATLYSVDMKVVRTTVEKEEKKRVEKKAKSQTKNTTRKSKPAPKR